MFLKYSILGLCRMIIISSVILVVFPIMNSCPANEQYGNFNDDEFGTEGSDNIYGRDNEGMGGFGGSNNPYRAPTPPPYGAQNQGFGVNRIQENLPEDDYQRNRFEGHNDRFQRGLGGAQPTLNQPQPSPFPPSPQNNNVAIIQGEEKTLASLRALDRLKNALMEGNFSKVSSVCQRKNGKDCGRAKNFLSICALILKSDSSIYGSGCLNVGSQRYRMDSESLSYAPKMSTGREAQTVVEHLVNQLKKGHSAMSEAKQNLFNSFCTTESLSLIKDATDNATIKEACLNFKYNGNPPPDVLVQETPAAPKPAPAPAPEPMPTPVVEEKVAAEEPKPCKQRKRKGKGKGKYTSCIKPSLVEDKETIIEDKEGPAEKPAEAAPTEVPAAAVTPAEPAIPAEAAPTEPAPAETAAEAPAETAHPNTMNAFVQNYTPEPNVLAGEASQYDSTLKPGMGEVSETGSVGPTGSPEEQAAADGEAQNQKTQEQQQQKQGWKKGEDIFSKATTTARGILKEKLGESSSLGSSLASGVLGGNEQSPQPTE